MLGSARAAAKVKMVLYLLNSPQFLTQSKAEEVVKQANLMLDNEASPVAIRIKMAQDLRKFLEGDKKVVSGEFSYEDMVTGMSASGERTTTIEVESFIE